MKNQQTTESTIIRPLQDAFEGEHVIPAAILAKGTQFPYYDRTDYPKSGGIFVYYVGMPYPKKGFPYPEAVHANDVLKRISLTMIKPIMQKEMRFPVILTALLPWRYKVKIIETGLNNFNRVAEWLLNGHYLKPDKYSSVCRSIKNIIQTFLMKLGISESVSEFFAKTIQTIIEYDDAYRYRIEDIMTEASYSQLCKDPRSEVNRLRNILNKRERTHAINTLDSVANFLSKALLHPKIKKAFIAAFYGLSDDEFISMRLDNADRYHVLLRSDYDFLGRTFEERKNLYEQFHKDRNLPYPPTMTVA